MKKLIVNADDFGYDKDTFEWTVKGFEEGKLSSATIMAGMPYTKQAVEYAKRHPQFSFGVHVYFSDEKSISDPNLIPTMIDPETGKLWKTRDFILRSMSGRISLRDLKREIKAQVCEIANTVGGGVKISHMDGHGHLHRLPLSLLALICLRKELGIKVVRRTQNMYGAHVGAASKWFNRLIQIPLRMFFKTTKSFLMTAGKIDESRRNWFSEQLAKDWDGVLEIGVHPGSAEDWRVLDCADMFETQYPSTVKLVTFNDL